MILQGSSCVIKCCILDELDDDKGPGVNGTSFLSIYVLLIEMVISKIHLLKLIYAAAWKSFMCMHCSLVMDVITHSYKACKLVCHL